jgi:hypothetical protein
MPEPTPGAKRFGSLPVPSHFSVAEARLGEFLKLHRETRAMKRDAVTAKVPFETVADLYVARLEQRGRIKAQMLVYWKEMLAALRKSWAELGETELRNLQ